MDNILPNAVDAIRHEGRVIIGFEEEAGHKAIFVDDNGRGIRGEELSRACDLFYTTKETEEGISHGKYGNSID